MLPPGGCFPWGVLPRGGGCFLRGVPGGDPTPGTATAAGGTHPTGMHSCCDMTLDMKFIEDRFIFCQLNKILTRLVNLSDVLPFVKLVRTKFSKRRFLTISFHFFFLPFIRNL